jgi:hypothetical protein
MLLAHWTRRAAARADWTAGMRRPMSVPMMAITTSSSTSVKPDREGGSEQGHRRQFEAGAWRRRVVMVAMG